MTISRGVGRGHRNGVPLGADHREKIRVTKLIQRLENFCLGESSGKDACILEPHQVTGILGLLRKVVPDLQAVEHSGEIKMECDLSAEPLSPEAWDEAYGADRTH